MITRSQRPIPLLLTALIALFSALAALAFAGGHDAHAHGSATHHPVAVSQEELILRSDMRQLWEEHVTWTRMAVVSLVAGSLDTNATVARLLRNQTDIGNAITPFYGRIAGAALTKELRAHILIAADVIAAAKAGDQAKLAAEQARWRANAADIATLLSRANQHWKRAALVAMLGEHLRLTTQEVVARLQGKWAADVAAYDRIHLHALHMADTFSAGIKAQFPGRFR
jgi:hypothetical protein